MTATLGQPKVTKCHAVQANRRAADFDCRLGPGHTVHVDTLTSQRWGEGGPPRGMRRKYPKKYANHKLNRQSAVMSRISTAKQKKGQ